MFSPTDQDINEIIKKCDKHLNLLANKTLLITGIAGFLGRYFLSVVKKYNSTNDQKINLVGIDNFISSGSYGLSVPKQQDENISFCELDLSIKNREMTSIAQNADVIVHAAGIASPEHYKASPLETMDVAINGCREFLDVCSENGAKFIFFSSSEIYGNAPASEIPIKETFKGLVSSTGPRACYDESKRVGETLCSVYNKFKGVHTNIIRPFNVYGPGMQSTDFRVMPNFAFRMKKGLPLQVYGDGNQTRTYCYISDAIAGFIKVFTDGKNGEAYNIGNPNDEISAHDLAKIFVYNARKNINIEVVNHPTGYPADEPDRRCPNIAKASQDLGYSPTVNLDNGVTRLLDFIC